MTNSEWFANVDGQNKGPMREEEIRSLIKSGVFSATTPVWREGMSDWLPAMNTELSSSIPQGNQIHHSTPPPHYMSAHVQGVPKEVYAGFWIRLAALIVDTLILMIPNLAINFTLLGKFIITEDSGEPKQLYAQLLGWLISSVYYTYVQAQFEGSFGKHALGLRLVREDFQKVTISTMILRYIMYFVSAVPFGLGLIVAGFSARKQGWHDRVAKTVVVDARFLEDYRRNNSPSNSQNPGGRNNSTFAA